MLALSHVFVIGFMTITNGTFSEHSVFDAKLIEMANATKSEYNGFYSKQNVNSRHCFVKKMSDGHDATLWIHPSAPDRIGQSSNLKVNWRLEHCANDSIEMVFKAQCENDHLIPNGFFSNHREHLAMFRVRIIQHSVHSPALAWTLSRGYHLNSEWRAIQRDNQRKTADIQSLQSALDGERRRFAECQFQANATIDTLIQRNRINDSSELRADLDSKCCDNAQARYRDAIISRWFGVGGLAAALIMCVAVCICHVRQRTKNLNEQTVKQEPRSSEAQNQPTQGIGIHSVMGNAKFGFGEIDAITEGEGMDAHKICAISQVTKSGCEGRRLSDELFAAEGPQTQCSGD